MLVLEGHHSLAPPEWPDPASEACMAFLVLGVLLAPTPSSRGLVGCGIASACKGGQIGELEVSLSLFMYYWWTPPAPSKTALLRCLPPSVSGRFPKGTGHSHLGSGSVLVLQG